MGADQSDYVVELPAASRRRSQHVLIRDRLALRSLLMGQARRKQLFRRGFRQSETGPVVSSASRSLSVAEVLRTMGLREWS